MAIDSQPTIQKRTGAYYTPRPLATFLARWAVRSPSDRVLDPACGEAVFLQAVVERLADLGGSEAAGEAIGYELDERTAERARQIEPRATIRTADFFDLRPCAARFQAVVGNPPYIRYHLFSGDARARALALAAQSGVGLSSLSSSWAPFVVHAATFLDPGGRLAFVLPGELLSTDYAGAIREFLRRRFGSVDVITFEERVFPGAMVDAVLVLAEGSGPGEVRLHRLADLQELMSFVPDNAPLVETGKWTNALITPAATDALAAAARHMQPLGAIASVDIGVVTGANRFFLLSQREVSAWRLPAEHLRRAIGRGTQLSAHALTFDDWEVRRRRGEIAWLFAPGSNVGSGPSCDYVRWGELQGVHQTYKCSIRSPWWALKLPSPPDLVMSYMSNHAPRLVGNDARVLTTNLLHNVRLASEGTDAHLLALAWHNSATMVSCELCGRAYGGGVLKLETREAERVLVPFIADEMGMELRRQERAIDALLAHGDTHGVADIVDGIVLSCVDPSRRAVLRQTWIDLRARRGRRSAAAKTPS